MTEMNERVLRITEQDIEAYIDDLTARGRSHITVRRYRSVIREMYACLPADKLLRKGMFEKRLFVISEEQDYSVSTINSTISAYNEFVRFMGYGDFRVERVQGDSAETPLLTKEDYHRLLETAKRTDNHRGYVLVKFFANSAVRVHDMPSVTVESVAEGVLYPKEREPVRISGILRDDLLEFASRRKIRSGYIFRTSRNTPISRHLVTKSISAVGQEAGFPEGYITPRSLQKFYATRIGDIRRMYEPVIESAFDAVLETEQRSLAW